MAIIMSVRICLATTTLAAALMAVARLMLVSKIRVQVLENAAAGLIVRQSHRILKDLVHALQAVMYVLKARAFVVLKYLVHNHAISLDARLKAVKEGLHVAAAIDIEDVD